MSASADQSVGDRPTYVAITPCRVADNRPGTDQVGPRATPLGSGETYTFTVRGTNGNCTIPADALAIVVNLAAISPTASGYFTMFPADVSRPLAANINFVAGQAPVSNAVTVGLSVAAGAVSIYNFTGSASFAVDIVGYYVGHDHDDRYYSEAEIDSRQWTGAQILDGSLADEDIGIFVAVVDSNGTLARSSGGITSLRVSAGNYRVELGRDITQCAYIGTLAQIGDVGTGGPGEIGLSLTNGTTDRLFVTTYTSAGALADRAFHVAVIC